MTYRRFSPEAEETARRWFENPFEQGWTIGERIGLRHTTAPHWAYKDNLKAVLKPGPDALIDMFEHQPLTDIFERSNASFVRRTPVAAIEKIAADLAHRGGFPVPPVALYENRDVPENLPNRAACLSLNPFAGEVSTTRNVLPTLGGDRLSAFIAADSAMTVFKGWLQNTDRHTANTVLEINSGAAAYPDFSISSLAHWIQGRSPLLKIQTDAEIVSRKDVKAAAARIMDISDRAIADIVHRLPDHYLGEAGKTMMNDNLILRKNNLMSLIIKTDATLTADNADDAAAIIEKRRGRLNRPALDLGD